MKVGDTVINKFVKSDKGFVIHTVDFGPWEDFLSVKNDENDKIDLWSLVTHAQKKTNYNYCRILLTEKTLKW